MLGMYINPKKSSIVDKNKKKTFQKTIANKSYSLSSDSRKTVL